MFILRPRSISNTFFFNEELKKLALMEVKKKRVSFNDIFWGINPFLFYSFLASKLQRDDFEKPEFVLLRLETLSKEGQNRKKEPQLIMNAVHIGQQSFRKHKKLLGIPKPSSFTHRKETTFILFFFPPQFFIKMLPMFLRPKYSDLVQFLGRKKKKRSKWFMKKTFHSLFPFVLFEGVFFF